MKKVLIEEFEPALLTFVIADRVIQSVEFVLKQELPNRDSYADMLCGKAQVCFEKNKSFRKKVLSKGNGGRDWLYAYMKHWIASFLYKDDRQLFDDFKEKVEWSNLGFGWEIPKIS